MESLWYNERDETAKKQIVECWCTVAKCRVSFLMGHERLGAKELGLAIIQHATSQKEKIDEITLGERVATKKCRV